MSGYGQVSAATITSAKQTRRIKKAKKVKLSLKKRIRNWLYEEDEADIPQLVSAEGNRLDSEGLRLQIYKASGGYVVETRSYDRAKDRSHNSMFVITEDQDLGDQLGKIVMMEALRG
jgi:hypothetical protein